MALIREPIKKPTTTSDGRWGPNDGSDKKKAFFYFVKDGDNWGTVAQADGWSDAKAFVRYNFGTDDPLEVNWYLKNFVGCKLQTTDKNNYRFSSDAAPGYIFTRKNLQPSKQPIGNAPPRPDLPPIDPDVKLKEVYGPPKTWFLAGVKVGGMAGPFGGDVICLVGVSMSGSLEGFNTIAFTTRLGGGIGASAGCTVGLVSQMQHPNQLFDYVQEESQWDANIAIGAKLGSLAKLSPLFAKNGPLHTFASQAGRLVSSGSIATTQGATAMFGSLKSMGQSVLYAMGPKSKFDAALFDVPFGGIGIEVSAFKARTGFRPFRTITRNPDGDLEDVIIPPDWLY